MAFKKVTYLLCFLFFVLVFIACDKAPDGVIKESKMAPLIADIALAEAYIEANPNSFMDDSSRMAMKQSIMLSHGTTIKEYEKSLDWYAHNLEIYTKVIDNAIAIIDKKAGAQDAILGKELQQNFADNNNAQQGGRKIYPNSGDTANMWTLSKSIALSGAFRQNIIPFDVSNNLNYKRGDRYNLNFKLTGSGNRINVFLAVDYADGTTSFMHRGSAMEGWGDYVLQSDSTRNVVRVYGYIGYNIQASSIAFVDSIQLIRTRLDNKNYNLFSMQRALGMKKAQQSPINPNPSGVNKRVSISSDRR